MAGRPAFEITDEVLEETKTLAGQGLTKAQIATCLGITYTTLKNKQNSNVSFLAAIKEGQAQGIQKVTNHLFEQSSKGNVTASIFYLKNRAPDEWHDRKELSIEDKTTKLLELNDHQLEQRRNEVLGITSETTH
jgi:predicted transcriptional regulator